MVYVVGRLGQAGWSRCAGRQREGLDILSRIGCRVQVGLIFDTAGWSSCRGDNTGPAGTFRPTIPRKTTAAKLAQCPSALSYLPPCHPNDSLICVLPFPTVRSISYESDLSVSFFFSIPELISMRRRDDLWSIVALSSSGSVFQLPTSDVRDD